MCDCYSHKCEGCDAQISIHIADFCTAQANVHPYCPACVRTETIGRRSWRKNKYCAERWPDRPEMHRSDVWQGGKCAQVFVSVVEDNWQIVREDKPVGRKGQVVVILCDDPRAYGIHLN